MYVHRMKRLQILIDEDLDAELAREASRTGRSKGALVRDALRRQMKPAPSIERDAIFDLAGTASFEPVAPEDIDDVVYGDA
jgi:Arc/MetJ family transcription regulator